jgi:hypothetical protein
MDVALWRTTFAMMVARHHCLSEMLVTLAPWSALPAFLVFHAVQRLLNNGKSAQKI